MPGPLGNSDAGFDPPPDDYAYNDEDKVRRSHDVRIFEDGEMWSLNQDGTVADNDKDDVPKDEDGNPDTGDRNYVDVRRTDIWRNQRGTGFHYQETFYHFYWPNEGKDMPDSREQEMMEVTGPPDDTEADEEEGDGSSGGPVQVPLIRSMVLESATNTKVNPYTRRVQFPMYIAKRLYFDNSPHDGRKTKEKKVDSGQLRVEIVKMFTVEAAEDAFWRDSRFVSEIWGDPDEDKTLYQEGSSKEGSGGSGIGGGDGGGE